MYYLREADFRYHCVAKREREGKKNNNNNTPPPLLQKTEQIYPFKLHI